MNNNVQWKKIEGYDGYFVSTTGQVKRRYKSGKIRVLRPWSNGLGYLYVSLCKNGCKRNFRINRLVAQAFIPNPKNLPEVDHINDDRSDNNVDNLQWLTKLENV